MWNFEKNSIEKMFGNIEIEDERPSNNSFGFSDIKPEITYHEISEFPIFKEKISTNSRVTRSSQQSEKSKPDRMSFPSF